MPGGITLLIAMSIALATLVGIVVLLVLSGGDELVDERLGALSTSGVAGRSGSGASRHGSRRGTQGAERVVNPKEDRRRKLEKRLVQAGLYRKNSMFYFVFTQIAILSASVLLGLCASYFGLAPKSTCLFAGAIVGICGIIAPGLVLDFWKRKRQTSVRRALPDALDVIVVCVEAGLSLPAALVRVSSELSTAHPMLAAEMTIAHREVQLGSSTGQALRNFADRFDLEEIRSLSSVVQQAEKFGASIVNALRVHADVLRRKRFQQAQERAQKATVKLLFPTVLLIFPSIFIVILGPAVFDIFALFRDMNVNIAG
ncbi:MAG: type II secretion system F family protein [Pirellulaceae bacterium]